MCLYGKNQINHLETITQIYIFKSIRTRNGYLFGISQLHSTFETEMLKLFSIKHFLYDIFFVSSDKKHIKSIFIFYCSPTLSENRHNSLLNLNNLTKKNDV